MKLDQARDCKCSSSESFLCVASPLSVLSVLRESLYFELEHYFVQMSIHDDSDDIGSWECTVCTYRNRFEAFKCEMCDTR